MRKMIFLIIFCLFEGLLVAQTQIKDCPDCPCVLRQANAMVKAEKYDQAIRLFNAYKVCAPEASAETDERIVAVFKRIEQQRNEAIAARREAKRQEQAAKAESRRAARLARSNANALKALQLGKTDLALRMAEMNYLLYPESRSAAGIFSEIISDASNFYNNKFYKKKTLEYGHYDKITAMAFSPDGQRALTASSDKRIIMWNVQGKQLKVFHQPYSAARALAFSPDGQLILSASYDDAILWDLSGDIIQTFKQENIQAAVFSPACPKDVNCPGQEKPYVLTGGGGTARLWSLDGREIQVFKGSFGSSISALAFSPNGNHIATGYSDGTASLWNLQGALLRTFGEEGRRGTNDNRINTVAFSPDGRMLLTESYKERCKLWELSGKLIRHFEDISRLSTLDFESAAFVTDGKSTLIAYPINDKEIVFRDLEGAKVKSFNMQDAFTNSLNLVGGIYDYSVFSPNGQYVLGSFENTVQLWDLRNNRFETLGVLEAFYGSYGSDFDVIAFSPDGQKILTGPSRQLEKSTLMLWDLNGNHLQIFRDLKGQISAAAFSPDSQRILTGSWDDDQVKLWDLEGRLIETFKGLWGITALAFSPDGRKILAGSGSVLSLWHIDEKDWLDWFFYDSDSGPALQFETDSDGYSLDALAFSPDGQYILSVSPESLKLWDLKGNLIRTFEHEDKDLYSGVRAFTSIGFSPDGQWAHISSFGEDVILWQVESGKQRIFKETGDVDAVSFLPDGRRLLTASNDTATLWNLNGQKIQSFHIPGADFGKLIFSPDGQKILATRNAAAPGQELELLDFPVAEEKWIYPFSTDSQASAIAFSPPCPEGVKCPLGERQYLLVGMDEEAKLLDLQGNEIQSFQTGKRFVTAVAFSSDGQYILTGTGELYERYPRRWGEQRKESQTATLWDLRGNKIQSFQVPGQGLNTLAISPDGQYILTGTDYTIKLWNRTGEEVFSVDLEVHAKAWREQRLTFNLNLATFTPSCPQGIKCPDRNKPYVLICTASMPYKSGEGSIQLYDLQGNKIYQSPHTNDVGPILALYPDGKFLARISIGGQPSGKVGLFDLKGKQIQSFAGHSAAALAPNGHWILTAAGHGVELWDLRGNAIFSFQSPIVHKPTRMANDFRPEVKTLTFSPDGQYILTLKKNGTVGLRLTPWAYLQQKIQPYSLGELKYRGLEFTQEDVEEMERRGRQW